jgi:peptidoglycan/LPS O-acetylase OafA/YrhL
MFAMAAIHDDYLRTPYFGSLDGLRAIAVLGVIWQHVAGVHGGALGRTGLGVSLFFAISGFLITTLLLREHRGNGSFSLRRFYIRRTLRIFPLYFAVLALYVALVALTRHGTEEGGQFFDNLPAYATYTSNWFVQGAAADSAIFYHAWSLATEEQFYLVWPVLLLAALALARPVGRALALAGVAVGVGVLVDQLATHAIEGSSFALTVVRSIATPICLGAILAAILHHPAGYVRARRLLGSPWAAPLLALALVAALQTLPTFWVELCMALLVAAVCVREDHPLAGALGAGPLRLVGVVSYGVYLMHMLAANAVRPLLGHNFGVDVFAAAAVVAVAMAYVSYRFFETPILRLKTRFGGASAPAPPAQRLVTAQPVRT